MPRTHLTLLCAAALSGAALSAAAAPAARADDATTSQAPAATAAAVDAAAASSAATATAASTQTATLVPDPTAWAIATAKHKYACVPDDTLSVRLVLKQHSVAAKVAFWLDDQRVGTATGAQLYGAHVKTHRVVRPQTFTNLPEGPMVLKVIVRTRGGASYLLRRVYYHCTPPQDAAKTVSVR